MPPIIQVENISKKYRIAHEHAHPSESIREALSKKGRDFFKRLKGEKITSHQDYSYEDFWALKELNFSVYPGDCLGIIGRNGAGKSTLLKVLSRITEPTTGKISIRGRIASLLEVGTGFHPDLTGRENIYLNGALLGMSRQEITQKFDEIVSFAEVEKFLDTPVKRYSSGMYTRLGFAIAAHLETDILIVDEVLAVGDASFQEKCIRKIQELGTNGRTILFVSHNVGTVLSLCNRAVFLEKGVQRLVGSVDDCVSAYVSSCPKASLSWEGDLGDEHLRIVKASLKSPESGKDYFYQGEQTLLEMHYELLKPHKGMVLGFGVWSSQNQLIARSRISDGMNCTPALTARGVHRIAFPIDAGLFHQGEYLIKIDYHIPHVKPVLLEDISLKFPVYARSHQSPSLEKEGISLGNRWRLE